MFWITFLTRLGKSVVLGPFTFKQAQEEQRKLKDRRSTLLPA